MVQKGAQTRDNASPLIVKESSLWSLEKINKAWTENNLFYVKYCYLVVSIL